MYTNYSILLSNFLLVSHSWYRVKRTKDKEGKLSHKLVKNDDELRNKFIGTVKRMQQRQNSKHNVTKDKAAAIKSVQQPALEIKGKKPEEKNVLIDSVLKNHNKGRGMKMSFDDKRLELQDRQLHAFEGMTESIKIMASSTKTNQDHRGELIVFINLDYVPESERDSVLALVDRFDMKLLCVWKGLMNRNGLDNKTKSKVLRNTIKALNGGSL